MRQILIIIRLKENLRLKNTGRFFFIYGTTERSSNSSNQKQTHRRYGHSFDLKLKNDHLFPAQKQLVTGHKTPGIALLGGAGMGQSPWISRSCRVNC